MPIRPARAEDAAALAPIILPVLEAMELPFLAAHGIETTRRLLTTAIQTAEYRYGYARGIVHISDGRITGAAFGYPSEDEAQIDQPFSVVLQQHRLDPAHRLFTDLEAFPDEWYLDTLAVAPQQRGRGIGAALLQALPEVALANGKNRIGLNVDEANPGARRLYSRLGYQTVGTRQLSGHRYEHMQKTLNHRKH